MASVLKVDGENGREIYSAFYSRFPQAIAPLYAPRISPKLGERFSSAFVKLAQGGLLQTLTINVWNLVGVRIAFFFAIDARSLGFLQSHLNNVKQIERDEAENRISAVSSDRKADWFSITSQ